MKLTNWKYCNLGHFKCNVDHRYGLVRKAVYSAHHKYEASCQPVSKLMENKISHVKIMSKKVDLLQAKLKKFIIETYVDI